MTGKNFYTLCAVKLFIKIKIQASDKKNLYLIVNTKHSIHRVGAQ